MSLLRDRFGQEPGADMQRFASSLAIDLRMLDEDVQGSMAHVPMLGEVWILAPEEGSVLSAGLARVDEGSSDGDGGPGAGKIGRSSAVKRAANGRRSF